MEGILQDLRFSMRQLVRTRGDAAAFVPAINNAIWSVDKDQPIVRVALYLSVIALLAFVSVIACSVPAWRAARIDPMVALRYE